MTSRVLVVDDDADFRSLARRILEGVGLAVIGEAGTVAAALVAARELEPSAVLLDVGLPDGDGIAFAEELVRLPWHPVVVLTSTDPDAADDAAVRRSGARAFVPKSELPGAPLRALLAGQ